MNSNAIEVEPEVKNINPGNVESKFTMQNSIRMVLEGRSAQINPRFRREAIKKSKNYFLKDEYMYRRPRFGGMLLRVLESTKSKMDVLKDAHGGGGGGHRGRDSTLSKEDRCRPDINSNWNAEYEIHMAIAANKIKKSRERNKIYFEKKHNIRHNPLEEGCMVLLYDSTIGKSRERKLDNRWNGPYIVTKSLGNGSYYLRELDGTRKRGSVAGNRLKRFYRSEDPRSQELIMQGEDVAVETDDEAEGS
ncbi:hypothetical protein AYI70_g11109 [Smittium culicis]|uniref:Retrovirus-related Pol polyprotein from transposon n=1 Tax=Smittium culicis TaxID=133412 RepID=A0A1R1X3B8_9FUNG|nr:hypothetical protein AYI70_g11109 [Smittium culicis]